MKNAVTLADLLSVEVVAHTCVKEPLCVSAIVFANGMFVASCVALYDYS